MIVSIISSFAIIGLPFAPVFAYDDGESKIDDPALGQAVNLIEEGAYKKAREKIDALRRTRPQDVNVRLLAGRLYRKIGLWHISIVEYEGARSKNPSLVEPYIALSEMHLENLSVEMALAMAQEAVYLAPDSVRAREALISSLIANHNAREAQAQLQGLMRARPNDPQSLYLSFKVNKGIGELEKAKADLERAMQMSPENVAWGFDLAEIYEATGEPKKARDAIEQYLKAAPDSTRALAKLAEILEFRLYDLDRARLVYDRMLEIEPDNQTAVTGIDRLQRKRNDLAAAIKRSIYRFIGFMFSLFQSTNSAKATFQPGVETSFCDSFRRS